MDPANAICVNGKFIFPEGTINSVPGRLSRVKAWMQRKAGAEQAVAVLEEFMTLRECGYPDGGEVEVVCLKARHAHYKPAPPLHLFSTCPRRCACDGPCC